MVIECINSAVIVWVMLFRIEPETLQRVPFSRVLHGLRNFFAFGMNCVIAIYAEFIGIMIHVVLAGRTHNQYAIAAWLCWGNFNSFTYSIGIGFGNVVRTSCGNLLGQGKIWSAKNNAIYSIFMSFLLGLSITLVVAIFIDTIVDIYAPGPGVAAELKPLFQIFCLAITPDLMNGTLTTTMRLSGKVVVVMHIFFWIFSCSWSILSFTGLSFGLSVQWMVWMYVLCDVFANGSMIYIIWKSQWEGLSEKEEKLKEMSLILS